MKLTVKDKDFLERLRALVDTDDGLFVELNAAPFKHFVLRRNYGTHVEFRFGMTRQGVRWRFQRLMDMYVSAYETILFIESSFGTRLRHDAMAVAKERAAARKASSLQSQSGSSAEMRPSAGAQRGHRHCR